VSVTSNSTQIDGGGPPHRGRHVASSDSNNGGASLVTNRGVGPSEDGLMTAEQARVTLWRELGSEPTLGEVIWFVDEVGPLADWDHEPTFAEVAERHARRRPNPASIRRRKQRHRSRRWVAAHELRACRECGDTFTPTDARQVFCSPACRKRYAYQAARRDAKRQADPTYVGRHVASSEPSRHRASRVTNRGLPNPICAQCGEPFIPKRTTQRFGSNACRQAAYRERAALDGGNAA
jgi:hypothetical protein